FVVRVKCLELLPGTIIAALSRLITNIALGVFHMARWEGDKVQDAFTQGMRALYFGALCFAASAYGVINPYDGRKIYNAYERELNNNQAHVDRRNNFYLAPCFTPLNYNAQDKTNFELTLLALKKKILLEK